MFISNRGVSKLFIEVIDIVFGFGVIDGHANRVVNLAVK